MTQKTVIQGGFGQDHGQAGRRSAVAGAAHCVAVAWRHDTIVGKAYGDRARDGIWEIQDHRRIRPWCRDR